VLRAMFEEEYLEEDAYRRALAADLGLRPSVERLSSTRFFVDRVREELAERHAPEVLEETGLRIFTTLDWRYQQLAEKAVRTGLVELEETYSWLRDRDPPLEGALLALDPHTGDVLAMVGGRDYGRSQFNRTIQAHRQPGSVFKAVVALAALAPPEPAFTLASVLDDEPLVVPAPEPEPGEEQEEDWIPFNHDEEFRGEVTLRQALEESLNIPMVRLGQDVGLRQVIRTARKLGIRSRLRPVPSLSLGTFEVSLLEITRAYAVLADEGRKATPRALMRVETAEGEKLEETPPRSERVFSREEVYLVTSALEGAVERGTGRRVRALGYAGPLAGKTGSSDEYRDGWFIGYTPEIAVGVWVGFDDETTTRRPGAFTALPIFTAFMKSAFGAGGGEGFEPPSGVESVSVVASAEHRAGLRCDGESEWFLAGTAPTESCGSFWRHLPAVGSGPEETPWWRRLAPSP
jgi:membrane peptidoglycan carboxypeptidase